MASKKSSSEAYFEWWLEELKEEGVVISYEREPKTFVIMEGLPINYTELRPKKGNIIKNFNLFQPMTYTPDYKVVFNPDMALNKIYSLISVENRFIVENEKGYSPYKDTVLLTTDENVLYFDVKPPANAIRFASNLGSSREFPIKQRLMYNLLGIYVNKVVPVGSKSSLFCKTFMPKRYRFTDANRGPRKLKDYERVCLYLKDYLTKINGNNGGDN